MDKKSAGESEKGIPLEDIRVISCAYDQFNPVKSDEMHTVLYHLPIADQTKPPKPHKGYSKWDSFHVHLPHSAKNQYPVERADGTTVIEPRWKMIEDALNKPIESSLELEAAILSYNTKYASSWKFNTLHELFEKELDEEESAQFFRNLLPKIVKLALQCPVLIATAIPLLKKHENRTISLSQQQVACLLANAFLCTFPKRNTLKRKSEYCRYPDINFNRLFQTSGQSCIEKIKSLCHYFLRVCNNPPIGVVTFQRRYISKDDCPKWDEVETLVGDAVLHITSEGTIEDDGDGLLQVDFANKYLGGGVLGHGCVQEEIRFVISPELMLSKLFTEELEPQEALLIIGSERYSTYSGYASTFTWTGNFEDTTPFDSSRRRKSYVVAIDAKEFYKPQSQFTNSNLLRELNKAYVGFYHPLETPASGVATGNWGCGAFGGEARLKSLLQLMVCATLRRPIAYFTFGDEELRDEVFEMYQFCKANQVSVGQLYQFIKEFGYKQLPVGQIYAFIAQQFYDSQQNLTDLPQEPAQIEKKKEEPQPIRTVLDSPKPSTSGTQQITTTRTTDKMKISSKYTRNILFDDSSSSLQSKFADLDLPTKKRASNSPMENSNRKKSLLDLLDQDYFGAIGAMKKTNGVRPEIEESYNLDNDVTDQLDITDISDKNQLAESKSTTVLISPQRDIKHEQHDAEGPLMNSNDDDSDEMIPSSPAAATVQAILQSKNTKSQEQKLKISDYFRPKS